MDCLKHDNDEQNEDTQKEHHHCHGEKVKDNATPAWGVANALTAKVPLSGELPHAQNPTAVWVLDVGKVLAVTFLNGALPDEKLKSADSHPLIAKLDEYEKRLNATIDHHRKKQSGIEHIGEVVVELFHHSDEVDDPHKLLPEIYQFVRSLQPKHAQAVGIEEKTESTRAIQKVPNSIQDYKDLFRLIPLPAVANGFESDETFSRYRVAGPNPMVIQCVTKPKLIDLVGDRISDHKFNEILKTCGDSVERAGHEGRLCVADYRELSGTSPVVVVNSSFVTDPIAVFAEPLHGKSHIMPIAILMGQDKNNSELVMADTMDNYRWQMAKTTVQAADMVHHEMVSHLAHTHLVMEAFSVATQRNLKEDHPLSRLLRPHFEGTNFINSAAANRLINTDGPIDEIFANDSPPRLRSLQGLATRARLGFDFVGRRPDKELASRGVERLKMFPYRDDIKVLWNAIQHWAHDYVEVYYEDDDAVKKDIQLAAWSQDLLTNGDLTNFEAPKTKELLAETLSMVMFLASAQHAAINFPQSQDMTFAPAMSGAVWSNFPPPEEYATENMWLRMMPPMSVAEEQLGVLYLLGGVHYRRLGEYHSNEFPYCGTLEKKVESALAAFRKELEAIETVIERRNCHRGSFAYRYLLPSEIPASINI